MIRGVLFDPQRRSMHKVDGEKKARALMIIIEKIIARHQNIHNRCVDEGMFKLFEKAKQINRAKTEDEFQLAIAGL